MATYINSRAGAEISQAEFSTGPHGQIGVYYLASPEAGEHVRGWLKETGQGVLSESMSGGHKILITQSDRTAEQNVHALNTRGDSFSLVNKKQGVDPWVIRSLLGFGGQGMQLASSFLRPNRKIDPSLFIFAAANLTANGINLVYKAQNVEDKHQLKFLKAKFNDELSPHLKEGEAPPAIDDRRLPLRPAEQEKRRNVDPFNDFMQRNSVKVGELGLRYIGAAGIALNVNPVFQGHLPTLNPNKMRGLAGWGSISGKTLALTSKIEDPYNPKPPTALDHFRENYSFLLGGLIEAGAFSVLAYDSLFKSGPLSKAYQDAVATGKSLETLSTGISFRKGGPVYRDWLSGIGGAMFVTGYIVRSWAKFGERKVNMNELYAHISDTLAKAPPEQIPGLLAQASAEIVEHFSKEKKPPSYSSVYSKIAMDLHSQHHIDVTPEGMQMHQHAEGDEHVTPAAQIAGPAQAEKMAHKQLAMAQ